MDNFEKFMDHLYDLHLTASRTNDAELKPLLLDLIDKVALIERNYDRVSGMSEKLRDIKSSSFSQVVLNNPMLLEYKKYIGFKKTLLNIAEIDSMFDFNMKYLSLNINFKREISLCDDIVSKKEYKRSVLLAYKDIFRKLIFDKISNQIRRQDDNLDFEKVKENSFLFEDHYPFMKEHKDFFDNDKEVQDYLINFLSNPIELTNEQMVKLNNFYDFETNKSSYELNTAFNMKNEYKKELVLLLKEIEKKITQVVHE